MRKYITILLVVMILSLSLHAVDYLQIGPDARTLARGGAGIAIINDAYAAFWNPAGIPNQRTFSSTFASLIGEVNYNYIGYTMPLTEGNVGFSYLRAGIDGLKNTTYVAGRPVDSGSEFSFRNSAFLLAYASPFNTFFPGTVGLTLKLIEQSLGSASATGLGFDFGLQGEYSPNLSWGLLVANLPIISKTRWSNGYQETLPYQIKAGVAWQYNPKTTLLADADLIGYDEAGLHFGAEYKLVDWFILRAGFEKQQYAFGCGLNISQARFDVAYTQAPADYLASSTRFTFSYDFKPSIHIELPSIISKPKQLDEIASNNIKTLTQNIIEKIVPDIVQADDLHLIPKIYIELPERTTNKVFVLKGTVWDGKTLFINGEQVQMEPDGFFKTRILLKLGENKITIKAYSLTKEWSKVEKTIILNRR